MKTEPITIVSPEDLTKFAGLLGITLVRGPGPRWAVVMEGRDEQKYQLVFEASAQPIFIGDSPVKVRPVTSLSFHAERVVED